MAPPQLNMAMITPVTSDIQPGPQLYLGPNASIENNTKGFSTAYLPINTDSTLTVGKGLNINVNGSSAALTIDHTGALNTNSTITAHEDITTDGTMWAKYINVNNGSFTVSDTGLTTMQDDLSIGDKVYVTKQTGKIHTVGPIETLSTLSVGSTVNSVGTVTIGNADASQYTIQLMNNGQITAKNNLYIGSNVDSDMFEVHADSGNMIAKGTAQINGSLTVGSQKMVVDSTTGDLTAEGTLKVSSSNIVRFSVDGSSGDLYTRGNLTVGERSTFNVSASDGTVDQKGDLNIWNGSNKIVEISANDGSIIGHKTLSIRDSSNNDFFTVNANAGSLQIGNRAANGQVHSSFTQYVKPASYTDKLTVDDSVSTTSATSDILTTQAYVDKAIWEQTKRINLIVGSNDTNLATFTNMFNMAQTLAGNDAVQTLGTLLDTTGEIKTSLTTVMNRAYNPVAVNCAPAVWADECPPMPIPSTISGTTYGLDGWYFTNSYLDNGAPSKINWYVPANGSNMQVNHLINLFLNVFAVSDKSLPFITVLTQPKGNATDLYPAFCNASLNFYFSASSASGNANKPYTLYTGAEEPANCYNTNKLRCFSTSARNGTNRTQNNNVGSITTVTSSTSFLNSFDNSIVSPTDKILCFVIQTASTAAELDVNMIINNLNVEAHDTSSDNSRDKVNGTTKFMFSNAAVATNYQYNYLFRTHIDFTGIDGTKSEQYLRSYNRKLGR